MVEIQSDAILQEEPSYSECAAEEVDAAICPICLDDICDTRAVLDCHHEFHTSCIIHHFRRGDPRCPMCRDTAGFEVNASRPAPPHVLEEAFVSITADIDVFMQPDTDDLVFTRPTFIGQLAGQYVIDQSQPTDTARNASSTETAIVTPRTSRPQSPVRPSSTNRRRRVAACRTLEHLSTLRTRALFSENEYISRGRAIRNKEREIRVQCRHLFEDIRRLKNQRRYHAFPTLRRQRAFVLEANRVLGISELVSRF